MIEQLKNLLAELERLDGLATKGPLYECEYRPGDKQLFISGQQNFYPNAPFIFVDHDDVDHDEMKANATLIVHARNTALPLARVAVLLGEALEGQRTLWKNKPDSQLRTVALADIDAALAEASEMLKGVDLG